MRIATTVQRTRAALTGSSTGRYGRLLSDARDRAAAGRAPVAARGRRDRARLRVRRLRRGDRVRRPRGRAAEAANHHPDILVHGWNKVRLTLSHALRRAGSPTPTSRSPSASTRSPERTARSARERPPSRRICCYRWSRRNAMNDDEDLPEVARPYGAAARRRRRAAPHPGRGARSRVSPPRERAAAHPRGRAGRDQRVLRDRRVRARALAPHAARGDARRGRSAAPRWRSQQLEHIDDYISACQVGDHDGLDRHRRARRARARPPARGRARARRSATASRSRSRRSSPSLIISCAQHRSPARWCRSSTRSITPRRSPGGSRAAAASFRVAVPPVHRRCSPAVADRHPAPARRRHRTREPAAGTPDELKRLIAESTPAVSSTSARRAC